MNCLSLTRVWREMETSHSAGPVHDNLQESIDDTKEMQTHGAGIIEMLLTQMKLETIMLVEKHPLLYLSNLTLKKA